MTVKKSNVGLTAEQYSILAEKKRLNPRTMTNRSLALWAKNELKLFKAPDISTICKGLNREKQEENQH